MRHLAVPVVLCLTVCLLSLCAAAQESPQRDPQAILLLTQAVSAMGGNAPGSSLATGTIDLVEGSLQPTGQIREVPVKNGSETKGQNPGSPELTALLGLSLVVYGSVISFLVARLVTYENWQKFSSLGTPQNFPLLIPFVLSPVVIYVVMEFWRVANTTSGKSVTPGTFLYDILALLFALLALQGFDAGIKEIPFHFPQEAFQDIIQKFCTRIAFGCLCLSVFLGFAVGRFWVSFGLRNAPEAIVFDSIGAVMSLAAAYFLMRKPPRYYLVFFMTSFGFVLAVGYLIRSLLPEVG